MGSVKKVCLSCGKKFPKPKKGGKKYCSGKCRGKEAMIRHWTKWIEKKYKVTLPKGQTP